MRRPLPAAAAPLILALVAACAGHQAEPGAAAPRQDRRIIGAEELQQAMAQNLTNADQLLRSRRPEWLSSSPLHSGMAGRMSRGVQWQQDVAVWMDGQRLGGPEVLRTILLSWLREVRLLSPSEAQAQLGLDNLGGAILLVRR